MEVKFKRLTDEAVMPIRAHKGDAGIDLTCTRIEQVANEARQVLLVYHTDLAVEIPEGHVGLLFPRSSIWKKSLAQSNAVGVIDSNYRGEIQVIMRSTTDTIPAIYKPGERFCQLVIIPIPEYTISETAELSETDHGENGFGSTGNTNKDISAATGSQSLPETEGEPTSSETATDASGGEANIPETAE